MLILLPLIQKNCFTHFVEETKDYVPVVATVSSTSHVVNNHDGTFDVTSPAGQDSTVIFMVYPSKETNYPTSVYSLTINRRTHMIRLNLLI